MRVNVARSRRLLDVRGPRVGLGYAVGVLGTAGGAAAMLPFRGHLDATDVVLIFLVVVVAAAATGGLGPGATAAVLGFLVSDILFVPPYDTLLVSKAQDLVSLAVYLLVTLVVSTLVGTSEQRRRRAQQRERETQVLYELSASLVAHGSLDATLERAARTVRRLLDLGGCGIVVLDGPRGPRVATRDGELPDDLLECALAALGALSPAGAQQAPGAPDWSRPPAAETPAGGASATTRGDGAAAAIARDGPAAKIPAGGAAAAAPGTLVTIPMRAADRPPVGVLAVVADSQGGGSLGAAEGRMLASFASQAALVVEQARSEEAWTRARALEATDRLRRALLNSVSHDLRTPLASVLASASSLLDPTVPLDEQERTQFLRTIEEEANRLARLVANLLDMSRIEAGAVDPRLAEVWLPDVVNPVVQRVRQTPSEQIIAVDVPESLPSVLVDPVRLEQVLSNLLDNARRYAGSGLVRIDGRPVGAGVELRIVDHGPGIPQGEHERIFSHFYRLDNPARRAGGTGLGLAICRGLLEAMGGHIWVETAPGGGAAFVLRLPAASGVAARVPDPAPAGRADE
jgi:two-component system sensor histidine kinase KdpD